MIFGFISFNFLFPHSCVVVLSFDFSSLLSFFFLFFLFSEKAEGKCVKSLSFCLLNSSSKFVSIRKSTKFHLTSVLCCLHDKTIIEKEGLEVVSFSGLMY